MSRNRKRRVDNTRIKHMYGVRSQECPKCQVELRPEDFTGDLCLWCVFDLNESRRRVAALQERNSRELQGMC